MPIDWSSLMQKYRQWLLLVPYAGILVCYHRTELKRGLDMIHWCSEWEYVGWSGQSSKYKVKIHASVQRPQTDQIMTKLLCAWIWCAQDAMYHVGPPCPVLSFVKIVKQKVSNISPLRISTELVYLCSQCKSCVSKPVRHLLVYRV